MKEELSAEEVAILIRSRKIINAKGLPRDVDVTEICAHAGISRKTGYQWAEKLNGPEGEQESLQQEYERLKQEHEELKKRFDDVRFENEGRKLAWRLHDVDQLLAEKKTLQHPKKRGSGDLFTS
jgi:transposase